MTWSAIYTQTNGLLQRLVLCEVLLLHRSAVEDGCGFRKQADAAGRVLSPRAPSACSEGI